MEIEHASGPGAGEHGAGTLAGGGFDKMKGNTAAGGAATAASRPAAAAQDTGRAAGLLAMMLEDGRLLGRSAVVARRS